MQARIHNILTFNLNADEELNSKSGHWYFWKMLSVQCYLTLPFRPTCAQSLLKLTADLGISSLQSTEQERAKAAGRLTLFSYYGY